MTTSKARLHHRAALKHLIQLLRLVLWLENPCNLLFLNEPQQFGLEGLRSRGFEESNHVRNWWVTRRIMKTKVLEDKDIKKQPRVEAGNGSRLRPWSGKQTTNQLDWISRVELS